MDKKTIGSFIAALRKAHGLTQQDVADRLNVSNKTVSKWERDESSPDLGLIPAIAEMYGVTCDEILLGQRSASDGGGAGQAAKVDRQVKRLTDSVRATFRSMAFLAVFLALVGYIVILLVSYSFEMPGLASALYMVFFAAGGALLAAALNNALNRLNASGDIGETAVETARAGLWLLFFGSVMALLLTFFLALPLMAGRGLYIPTWPPDHETEIIVLSWFYYVRYITAMLLMWMASALPVYFLLRKKLHTGGSWLFAPVENGFKMQRFQLIFIGLILFIQMNPFKSYTSAIHPLVGIVLSWLCLVSAVAVVVVYAGITKPSRALLLAMGARNLLLYYPAGFLILFIQQTVETGYKFHNDLVKYTFVVNPVGTGLISIPLLVFTALVPLAYAALKYRIVKRKNLPKSDLPPSAE